MKDPVSIIAHTSRSCSSTVTKISGPRVGCGCGKRKIWLDPNEMSEISNANSRQTIRKLVSDGLIPCGDERPGQHHSTHITKLFLHCNENIGSTSWVLDQDVSFISKLLLNFSNALPCAVEFMPNTQLVDPRSSQILRLPQPTTEAARRFWVVRLTLW
jgi:hypothetical protein